MAKLDLHNQERNLQVNSIRPLAACLAGALGIGSAASAAMPEQLGRLAVYPEASSRSAYAARAQQRARADSISAPQATTHVVTNCNDSGTGSLRDTVAIAASGDTIGLNQLNCSTITLTTGEIQILQNDLTLNGPGPSALQISGYESSRVFSHQGGGTLSINGLKTKYGSPTTGGGGCIFSTGNVTLNNSIVSSCTDRSYRARGGGIYTQANLSLYGSIVTGNTADALGGSNGFGGGAFVRGNLIARYSTIDNNVASGGFPIGGGLYALGVTNLHTSSVSGNSAYAGGGVFTADNVSIDRSTISNNRANQAAGLLAFYAQRATAVITNSTISGNSATIQIGGAFVRIPLTLSNSTIAFNSVASSQGGAGGLEAYGLTLDLESSIIANNTTAGDLNDLGGSTHVSSANSLITHGAVAGETFNDACPRLQPLADNGGPTFTHALLHVSPAIDAGNNAVGLGTDQRGAPRVFAARADIGAFEYQGGLDDEIFRSQFENRCQ